MAAAAKGPFLMAIEEIFSISGRGTVVTGRIETGTVNVGDEIEIVGMRATLRARVAGVEMFRKLRNSARAGDNVGILLAGIGKDQLERGQVLARPRSIRACGQFDARISGLKGPDGRSRRLTGIRSAQLYFRTTDVTAKISPRAGRAADGTTRVHVELVAPIAMNPGLAFSVRQDHRTIGFGSVLRCTD